MQVPRMREDHRQHGPRRGDHEPEDARRRRSRSSGRITGQSPVVTKAKKAIATFKLRAGPEDRRHGHPAPRAHVGVLRSAGERRAAPRPRLPGRVAARRSTGAATTRSASGSRSSSPRSTTTRSTRSRGMNITIVTTARTDDEGRALLEHLGMPFRTVRDGPAGADDACHRLAG